MPETPEQFYERVKDSLRMPPVQEWDTFPFDGEMRPRELHPPDDRDPKRLGDGGEHLHWWFMSRPARFPQLIGSFAAIWDDILPPVPEDIWQERIQIVVDELNAQT